MIDIKPPKGRGREYNEGWRAAQKGKKPKDCPYNKQNYESHEGWDKWFYAGGLKKQDWLDGFRAFQRRRQQFNRELKKHEAADAELAAIIDLARELEL